MSQHYKRLQQLRALMRERRIDYYLITTQDYHNSEYVHDYFKEREYISGFTGSNGTLLVSFEEAGLWTDGRYYIQAEEELVGSGITLYKMQEKDVPTIEKFLDGRMQKGQRLGFCGKCVTTSYGEKLETVCRRHEAELVSDVDLPRNMWTDAPLIPANPVWILEEKYTGCDATEKLTMLRSWMLKKNGAYYFTAKLDDIMWLYNIRGGDVECNPVALSYTLVGMEQAFLFLQKQAVTEALKEYLAKCQITLVEYDEVETWLKEYPFRADEQVLISKNELSYGLFKVLENCVKLLDEKNIIEEFKAVKNPVELANVEQAYLQDSAAMCRFIYWLKKQVCAGSTVTELSAAEKLDDLRRKLPGFLDLSFPTICGYKENAAIVHYEASEKTNRMIQAEGMVLVDSGGQYLQGTTDITRTIVLGSITEEEKELFSAIAAGMLRLADAVFPEGCTGRNLDILAREALWKKGLDYRHGTGHGIGYALNVHEGSHSLRWKYVEGVSETILKPGMLVSDEPGIYLEGKFGVRIENIIQVAEAEKTEYGSFLKFKMLTWVPIDLEALDAKYLTEEDIIRINAYHQKVYEKIVSYLPLEEEKEWLRKATLPIDF